MSKSSNAVILIIAGFVGFLILQHKTGYANDVKTQIATSSPEPNVLSIPDKNITSSILSRTIFPTNTNIPKAQVTAKSIVDSISNRINRQKLNFGGTPQSSNSQKNRFVPSPVRYTPEQLRSILKNPNPNYRQLLDL